MEVEALAHALNRKLLEVAEAHEGAETGEVGEAAAGF
jgi:hypothetical protein